VNPFAALGLPASPGLDDEQVRRAWRETATATHPDQPGGGNPASYTAASAAYAQLRTAWGRAEALADLTAGTAIPRPAAPGPLPAFTAWHPIALLPARIRHGRPGRLAVRSLIAAAVAVLAVTVVPGTPSAPAVVTGCALW
jgi:hypothetical protein